MFLGNIEMQVFFPPIQPLKRELLKAWAKEWPGDRIIDVIKKDDWNRWAVEVKTRAGKRLFYIFDRSRIMSFNISDVPKRHRHYVKEQLLKFTPTYELISTQHLIRTPHYDDVIRAYWTNRALIEFRIDERDRILKEAYRNTTNVEEFTIKALTNAPNYGKHVRFDEVENIVMHDKQRTTTYYIEPVYSTRRQKDAYALVSRNIFLNWHWWERPDVSAFFV